jgi:predicted lipid-binding transport protein (Tim44 family)
MRNLILAVLIVFLTATTWIVEAGTRMGGGKSMGTQSTNVTKRSAVPPAANTAPAAAKPAVPATTPVAAPAARPWGAMIGGVAAGLGLAWLASSLGLGEAFGNILMFMLLGLIMFAVIGWWLHRRNRPVSDPKLQQEPTA